jgi:hypothetical protein
MKKHLLLLAATALLGPAARAQLTDTRWTGTVNAPDPVPVVLHFKTDTLIIHVAGDPANVIETMQFSLKDNRLTLYKLDGLSPCDNTTAGIYSALVKDNNLSLTVVEDRCAQRAEAFPAEPFKRSK